MTDETVSVKLCDLDRVEKLLDLLEGYPEDAQTVFDLTLVALVVAEIMGVEVDSMYSALGQQYPLARKMANRLVGEA